MDNLQLKIQKHQTALKTYLKNLAEEYNTALGNDMNYQAIIDMESNHFQFIKMGWYKHQFIFSVLMHFDIHAETGNIWIQQNNTEIQVDLELERLAEITKRHLILGFRPKYMREASDFAVV
jgi:hypothetical protein